MSSIGRSELAANEKAFKYEFSLEILALKCEIPFPSSLKFMWRRNLKGIQSKQSYEVGSGIVQLNLTERLSSMSTLIFNTQKRQFLPKESQLIINMYFNSSPKKLASTKIDMRTILDPNNYKISRSQTFQVQLKPCVNVAGVCRLQYRLSSFFSEELVPSQKSIGTATLNVSGLSIQPQKFFQKKYDVPSNDNYSVNSYNTVGRHPSANKRDDSASIRKLDYGKKNEKATYLTGLKSNISNQQGEFDTRSGFRSIQNKTDFGEGNYLNRQLIQEQNKRSRAEAELNKNTVEIGELKKKMNEMLIQNLKLKEELRNSAAIKENASKQELNALQFKLYQLNNETRQSKNQLELKKRQYEAETARFRTEKSTLQAELLTRQKRIEELQRTTLSAKLTEQIQNDNRELKYQVENLRKFIEQINRQNSQQQQKTLRQMQELKNAVNVLQTQKQKLQQKQRQLMANCRQIQEYKSRLSRYENQKSILQREIIKLQNESQSKAVKLNTDNARTNDQLRFYQQKLQEAQKNTQKLEEEKIQLEGRSAKLLPQMNQLQKRINQNQAELSQWRNRYNELQNEINSYKKKMAQLQNENQKLKNQKEEAKMYASSNGEVDRLMRQSLQQQVQLKFVKDELSRLQNIEQAYENQKWRADKQKSERESLQKENQRIEKELTNKNRALLIQVQKGKHTKEQLDETFDTLSQYKEQLQKNRSIIYANDQQNLELKQTIKALQAEMGRMSDENKQLRIERQRLLSSGEQLRNLQMKITELEARDAQKLQTIQNQNRNCMLAQNEIKELQNRLQYLQYEMGNKEKFSNELQVKNRQLERVRATAEAEKNKILQDLKQEEKKNRVIMQEIHGMKKRYQQEKGRSVSFTRVEQVNRIREMDAALQKKDKMISKLNKQKLQIEQENIKMNVQVMKLLSQLEKVKASSMNQTSLKNIGFK